MSGKFVLEINTDNDAFEGEGGEAGRYEVARILEAVIAAVGFGHTDFPLHDINGNKVGFVTWMDEDGHRR